MCVVCLQASIKELSQLWLPIYVQPNLLPHRKIHILSTFMARYTCGFGTWAACTIVCVLFHHAHVAHMLCYMLCCLYSQKSS